MFRVLEGSEGKIIIDGIDISTIGLHDLHGNLNIISQVRCVLEITGVFLFWFFFAQDTSFFGEIVTPKLTGGQEIEA